MFKILKNNYYTKFYNTINKKLFRHSNFKTINKVKILNNFFAAEYMFFYMFLIKFITIIIF